MTFVTQPSPGCAEIKPANAFEGQEVQDVRMVLRERSSWLGCCWNLSWEPSPMLEGSPGDGMDGSLRKLTFLRGEDVALSSLNPVLALKDKGTWAGGPGVSCCCHLPQVLLSPVFEKGKI